MTAAGNLGVPSLGQLDDVVFTEEVRWLNICRVDKLQELYSSADSFTVMSIQSRYAVERILEVNLQ